MKKKNRKIILYAGVLTAIICLVSVSSAVKPNESIEKSDSGDTKGCNRIYDVNRDTVINFQDAGLCWVYIQDDVDDPYGNLLYDVNMDGNVNFQDAGLIWINRD